MRTDWDLRGQIGSRVRSGAGEYCRRIRAAERSASLRSTCSLHADRLTKCRSHLSGCSWYGSIWTSMKLTEPSDKYEEIARMLTRLDQVLAAQAIAKRARLRTGLTTVDCRLRLPTAD